MTTTYTPELHARLRELSKNATSRPWHIEPAENMVVYGDEETGEEVGAKYYHRSRSKKTKANRALIVEAPNATDILLDEIERLQAELQTAQSKAWQEGYADGYHDHINVSMIEAGHRKPTTNPYEERSR